MEGEAGYGGRWRRPGLERSLATLGEDFHITQMTFQEPRLLRPCLSPRSTARSRSSADGRRRGGHRATCESGATVRRWRSPGFAEPATAAEARFSTPYLVATALTHGSVRLAAFEPARLEDAVTRSLMRRVGDGPRPRARRGISGAARRARRDRSAPTDGAANTSRPRARATRTCRSPTPSSSTSISSSFRPCSAKNARAGCSRGCGGWRAKRGSAPPRGVSPRPSSPPAPSRSSARPVTRRRTARAPWASCASTATRDASRLTYQARRGAEGWRARVPHYVS